MGMRKSHQRYSQGTSHGSTIHNTYGLQVCPHEYAPDGAHVRVAWQTRCHACTRLHSPPHVHSNKTILTAPPLHHARPPHSSAGMFCQPIRHIGSVGPTDPGSTATCPLPACQGYPTLGCGVLQHCCHTPRVLRASGTLVSTIAALRAPLGSPSPTAAQHGLMAAACALPQLPRWGRLRHSCTAFVCAACPAAIIPLAFANTDSRIPAQPPTVVPDPKTGGDRVHASTAETPQLHTALV